MRLSLVAALGVAAGLIAGPALAATHHHHHHHTAKSHMASRHHMRGTHGAMAGSPNAQNGEVERLNNMSLQAAQRGHNYAPPGAMGGAPAPGGMPATGPGMHR